MSSDSEKSDDSEYDPELNVPSRPPSDVDDSEYVGYEQVHSDDEEAVMAEMDDELGAAVGLRRAAGTR